MAGGSAESPLATMWGTQEQTPATHRAPVSQHRPCAWLQHSSTVSLPSHCMRRPRPGVCFPLGTSWGGNAGPLYVLSTISPWQVLSRPRGKHRQCAIGVFCTKGKGPGGQGGCPLSHITGGA